MGLFSYILDTFAEIGAANRCERERREYKKIGNDGFGDNYFKLVDSDDGTRCDVVYREPTRPYFVNIKKVDERKYRITVDYIPIEDAEKSLQTSNEWMIHIPISLLRYKYSVFGDVEIVIPEDVTVRGELW